MSASAANLRETSSRVGKIGPNAITRLIEALGETEGAPAVRRIFQTARLEAYLFEPPTDMVDERDVAEVEWRAGADRIERVTVVPLAQRDRRGDVDVGVFSR